MESIERKHKSMLIESISEHTNNLVEFLAVVEDESINLGISSLVIDTLVLKAAQVRCYCKA